MYGEPEEKLWKWFNEKFMPDLQERTKPAKDTLPEMRKEVKR
jgi:hypothetical protein